MSLRRRRRHGVYLACSCGAQEQERQAAEAARKAEERSAEVLKRFGEKQEAERKSAWLAAIDHNRPKGSLSLAHQDATFASPLSPFPIGVRLSNPFTLACQPKQVRRQPARASLVRACPIPDDHWLLPQGCKLPACDSGLGDRPAASRRRPLRGRGCSVVLDPACKQRLASNLRPACRNCKHRTRVSAEDTRKRILLVAFAVSAAVSTDMCRALGP